MNCIKTEKKTIGLVTPSSPAPACFPERFQRGVENLENMGFRVKYGKHVLTKDGLTSASAEERAMDINHLFEDKDVSLIMATIGGDFAAEILPYLDWNIICQNKKGFIGYSDITVLLHAIGIKGKQVVYYGPTLMTEIAEYPNPPYLSTNAFLQIFDELNEKIISPSDLLMEKGTDWGLSPKERKLVCPVSQKTIRSGCAEGIVLGGCVEALERLRGTEFWPDFTNAIMLLETVDEEFNEKKWRAIISDYINMGVMKKISGLIIGQKLWDSHEIELLSSMLIEATQDTKIPILYGLPFGHISPIATFPLFTKAFFDADAKNLTYDKIFKYEYDER